MSPVFFTDRDLGRAFPDVLRSSGLQVKRHDEHLPPNATDEEWLEFVGRNGWVAITHDRRIRYKPNERAAVFRHRVALLVVIGKAPCPVLARHFVATMPRVSAFLARHRPPFIARVCRPSPKEFLHNPAAPGSVVLWQS